MLPGMKAVLSLAFCLSLLSSAVPAQDAPAPAAPAAKPAPVKPKTPAVPTWNSTNGQSVQAEFVRLELPYVILKRTDGLEIKVPATALTVESQKLAKELDERQHAPAPFEKEAAPNLLPVFTAGPDKGACVVHETPYYRVKLNAQATLTVICLDNGKPVGPSIVLSYGHGYSAGTKYFNRKVVSYSLRPTPSASADSFALEGLLEDESKFGFYGKFDDKSIECWGWVDDDPSCKYPTRFTVAARFPESHKFDPQTPVEERKKVVGPYSVEIKPVKGKSVVYPYGEATQDFGSAASKLEVKGPLFGSRKVSVQTTPSAGVSLTPYKYPKYAPYQGYSASLAESDTTSSGPKAHLILRIE